MSRDPVQVVQAPLPRRHLGMLLRGDHRGGNEVPACQPRIGDLRQHLQQPRDLITRAGRGSADDEMRACETGIGGLLFRA